MTPVLLNVYFMKGEITDFPISADELCQSAQLQVTEAKAFTALRRQNSAEDFS